MTHSHKQDKGPFTAQQVPTGSRYELTRGHPVWCAPGGGQHASKNAIGALPLSTDPGVEEIGVDVGYTPSEDTLRAPDIAVGNVPSTPGWVDGVPPLAVEYADTGTNENDLQQKIRELLAAGTQYIWVVRLTGPRRVEIYQPNQPMKIAEPSAMLSAPGILKNELPVRALYERESALDTTFRNLLQRHGYPSLEAVKAEGISQGITQGITQGISQGITQGISQGVAQGISRGEATALLTVLEARGLAISESERQQIVSCQDSEQLTSWIKRSISVQSAAELLASK